MLHEEIWMLKAIRKFFVFTYCVIYHNIQCSKKLKDSKVILFAPLVFNFYRFTGNIIDTQSIEIYSYETKGPKFKIFKDKVMVGRKLFDSMHRFYNIDKLSFKLYLYFLFIFFITAFLMQNGRNKFNYANRRRIYLLIYISMVRSS